MASMFNFPPGAGSSIIKDQALTGLQTQVDQKNQLTLNDINGTLNVYWADREQTDNPSTPYPISFPWQVDNTAKASILFDALQNGLQLHMPTSTIAGYETAITTMQVKLPANVRSVSIDPSTHMPVYVMVPVAGNVSSTPVQIINLDAQKAALDAQSAKHASLATMEAEIQDLENKLHPTS